MTDVPVAPGMHYRLAETGQVRDVDSSKREALVTFPLETLDSYKSDFQRDAFDANLRQRLPVMCWQHQRAEPIGRATHWQNTGTANEFVTKFSDFDAVPLARRAFTQLEDGTLTDFSYGFDQARAVAHPSGERGALRFTHARMAEISPVTVGSIPGAKLVSLREDEQATDAATVVKLIDQGVIEPEEGRLMLRMAAREVVTIAAPAVTVATGPETQTRAGDDGDPASLALAVDASLDAMTAILDSNDETALPPWAQQALSLARAAGVASDDLLDSLNVDDPDEGTGDAQRGAAADVPVEPHATDDTAQVRGEDLDLELRTAMALRHR